MNTNDGTTAAPRLRCYFNLLALEGLTQGIEQISEAGYDGVQFAETPDGADLALCRRLGLGTAGSLRVNEPSEAGPFTSELAAAGLECATVHLGWGMEDDDAGARLIESVLKASERYRLPLYVETHRATLFQDLWRAVRFVERFPELRFNGDFSHWYTGQEMVYGGFERKFAFIAPVLERVRFLHGRIGNPGSIQVDVGDGDSGRYPFVAHFRQMWTAAMAGFVATAAPGDFLCFTPELLAPRIYYAREFRDPKGEVREETDRWQQSLVLAGIARECFDAARKMSAAAY